jgi:hypothetical protein
MPVLNFILVPAYEKDAFKFQFQTYLEELDMIVGDPIDPDFAHRYPIYDQFFLDNMEKQPFRIFSAENNVGFFFLEMMTPSQFPASITPLISPDRTVASLTNFHIFPEYRGQHLAWGFYESIIRLANDYDWDICWECDVRNKIAVQFYNKVIERIHSEFSLEVKTDHYQKTDQKGQEFVFYQIKFK